MMHTRVSMHKHMHTCMHAHKHAHTHTHTTHIYITTITDNTVARPFDPERVHMYSKLLYGITAVLTLYLLRALQNLAKNVI